MGASRDEMSDLRAPPVTLIWLEATILKATEHNLHLEPFNSHKVWLPRRHITAFVSHQENISEPATSGAFLVPLWWARKSQIHEAPEAILQGPWPHRTTDENSIAPTIK